MTVRRHGTGHGPSWAGGRYPSTTSLATTAVMQANVRKDTKPEVLLRSHLHARRLRYRKDLRIDLPQGHVRPDIVFTRGKVAVFVDGCFWHGCPVHGRQPKTNEWYWGPKLARNIERDAAVVLWLQAAGWSAIRIWEHADMAHEADRIQRQVRGQGSSAIS